MNLSACSFSCYRKSEKGVERMVEMINAADAPARERLAGVLQSITHVLVFGQCPGCKGSGEGAKSIYNGHLDVVGTECPRCHGKGQCSMWLPIDEFARILSP